MPREVFVLLLLVTVAFFPLPYLVLFRFGRFRIKQAVLKALDFELEASEPTSPLPSVAPQPEKEVAPVSSLGPGKLVRVSEEAHKAVKVAAAIEDKTMEEWLSEVVLQQAKSIRRRGAGASSAAAIPPRNRRSK